MARYGLAFDIEYCNGCNTCTVACKQENGFKEGVFGIKITEFIQKDREDHVQIDYIPFPTTLCNLCGARIASGFDDKPSCVKHCQTECIAYGSEEELLAKSKDMKRPVIYLK